MTARLGALRIDAIDPPGLALFWSEVLGREVVDDTVLLPEDAGFRIRFVPTREPKISQNSMHFDLTSTSSDDQQHTVARAIALGARHVDVGQRPEERHVVLADPEGNEFCVIEPGNAFLDGCGFLGALACDGSQQVGYFWSEVLGWPLVWDQDLETAIRSPRGGPKITWGGTPPAGPNRLRFELVPPPGEDRDNEVERLVVRGASRVAPGPEAGRITMTDPDGNEFCVVMSQ